MNQRDHLGMPQNQPHLRVREVLRRWDPVGVISDRNQDEYDSYSVPIVRMLDRGATVDEIVEQMRRIVTVDMGMSRFDEPHGRDCAQALVDHWRSLQTG